MKTARMRPFARTHERKMEKDMLSDIEIAESAELIDIREVAKKLDLTENELELYGKYKAKITLPKTAKRKAKLVLVTAINPTASGEGKTTVSIGLADGLTKIGKKACLALFDSIYIEFYFIPIFYSGCKITQFTLILHR